MWAASDVAVSRLSRLLMAVVVLTGVLTLSARSAPRVAAVEPSAAPGVVETMSRDVTGAARSGGDASVSADGRYVAFTSSEELDSDISTLRRNVYVRDRLAGETFLISRGQIVAGDRVFGEQSADGDSYAPSISADGRYVAFITTATNLHTGDTDRSPDVIICDRNPRGDGVFDQRAPTGFMDYRFVYAGKPTMVKGERITGNREAVPSLAAQGTAVAWQNVVPAASGVASTARCSSPGWPRTNAGGSIRPVSTESVSGCRGSVSWRLLLRRCPPTGVIWWPRWCWRPLPRLG